ncbi:MAG: hypothetical protein WBO46_23185 [Caldilineaceae bacterium]
MNTVQQVISPVNPESVNWNSAPQAVNWNSGPAAYVTAAYGWGFADGAGGQDLAVSDIFPHSDPRWTEFVQGYVAGAQASGYERAATAALCLLEGEAILEEMESPFYSGHEHEMVLAGPPEMMCGICGQPWSKCRCSAQRRAVA